MANKKPLVTILMPVYNGASYLREAMDSILQQTYSNFKLLIINDGSTDRTQEILDSYADPRITLVQQENIGVARSLNKGLDMITTEYVRRHDADDISEPWMLKWQVDFLEKNRKVAAVSTRCNFMTQNSKISEQHFQPKDNIFNGENLIYTKKEHFYPYSPIVHGSVLCRKSIFDEFKGYRTEFLTSEDNDLWLRIIEKYPFAILNKSPYKLRLSPGSATKTHKTSTRFFRELALKYSDERREKGNDPLMRRETIRDITYENPKPGYEIMAKKGLIFPDEILHFHYQVCVAAKDWHGAISDISDSLKIGWRLTRTWKAIIFPLLGTRLIKMGVSLKRKFTF